MLENIKIITGDKILFRGLNFNLILFKNLFFLAIFFYSSSYINKILTFPENKTLYLT